MELLLWVPQLHQVGRFLSSPHGPMRRDSKEKRHLLVERKSTSSIAGLSLSVLLLLLASLKSALVVVGPQITNRGRALNIEALANWTKILQRQRATLNLESRGASS